MITFQVFNNQDGHADLNSKTVLIAQGPILTTTRRQRVSSNEQSVISGGKGFQGLKEHFVRF